MTSPLPIKAIRSLVSYRPEVAALPPGRIIRLSVNEGALGPSPEAVAALNQITPPCIVIPNRLINAGRRPC